MPTSTGRSKCSRNWRYSHPYRLTASVSPRVDSAFDNEDLGQRRHQIRTLDWQMKAWLRFAYQRVILHFHFTAALYNLWKRRSYGFVVPPSVLVRRSLILPGKPFNLSFKFPIPQSERSDLFNSSKERFRTHPTCRCERRIRYNWYENACRPMRTNERFYTRQLILAIVYTTKKLVEMSRYQPDIDPIKLSKICSRLPFLNF